MITVFFNPGLEVSLQSFLDNRSVQYYDSSHPLEQRQIEILIHTVDSDRLQLIPARIHRCSKKCFYLACHQQTLGASYLNGV